MKKFEKTGIIKESILILPDIRSAINVGAIFRTADAVGIDKIFLTGVTPRPTDKFGRVQKDIARSALGAELWVPWEYEKETLSLIKKLKREGYYIVALEQNDKSKDYRDIKLAKKMVFVLGQEVTGVEKDVLKKCDEIAEIPMSGRKESLNVSVACGIFLFRIFQQ